MSNIQSFMAQLRLPRSSTPVKRTGYTGAELRAMRADYGVGRPPKRMPKEIAAERAAIALDLIRALAAYGSQRAAARSLGMNLSTFQRRLKKAQGL